MRLSRSAFRAADILELIAGRPEGLSGTAVALRLGLPRSTAHLLIASLIHAGYLRREGRLLVPGLRLDLLITYPVRQTEASRTRTVLCRLAARTAAHVALWVREGNASILVAAEGTQGWQELPSEVGMRVPLSQGAAGRVFSAGPEGAGGRLGAGDAAAAAERRCRAAVEAIDRTDLQRWGVLYECPDTADGFHTLAAPVHGAESEALRACLSMTLPASRLGGGGLRQAEKDLRSAVRSLEPLRRSPLRHTRRRGFRVAWSMARLQLPFYAETYWTAEALAPGLGLDLIWANAHEYVEKQAADIDRLTDCSPDLVIVHPVHAQLSAPLLDGLADQETPVICFQRPCRSTAPLTFVGGDTYEAGRLELRAAAQALEGRGRLLLIGGDPDNDNARNLVQGWHDELAAHPALQVVAEPMISKWSPAAAAAAAEQAVREGTVDGVVVANDEMAGAVIAAMGQDARARIPVIGGDGDFEALQRLHDGRQYGTVFQDPRELCRQTLSLAADILHGRLDPAELPLRDIVHGVGRVRAHARLLAYHLCTHRDHEALADFWGALPDPPAAPGGHGDSRRAHGGDGVATRRRTRA